MENKILEENQNQNNIYIYKFMFDYVPENATSSDDKLLYEFYTSTLPVNSKDGISFEGIDCLIKSQINGKLGHNHLSLNYFELVTPEEKIPLINPLRSKAFIIQLNLINADSFLILTKEEAKKVFLEMVKETSLSLVEIDDEFKAENKNTDISSTKVNGYDDNDVDIAVDDNNEEEIEEDEEINDIFDED